VTADGFDRRVRQALQALYQCNQPATAPAPAHILPVHVVKPPVVGPCFTFLLARLRKTAGGRMLLPLLVFFTTASAAAGAACAQQLPQRQPFADCLSWKLATASAGNAAHRDRRPGVAHYFALLLFLAFCHAACRGTRLLNHSFRQVCRSLSKQMCFPGVHSTAAVQRQVSPRSWAIDSCSTSVQTECVNGITALYQACYFSSLAA
jgi:hypothetical protein